MPANSHVVTLLADQVIDLQPRIIYLVQLALQEFLLQLYKKRILERLENTLERYKV